MGDLGYVDDEGRFWFCGRKDHRVETRGGTLFTAACEGVFDAHPSVRRSGLVGVETADGTIPVMCVEAEPHANRESLRSDLLELARRYSATRSIGTVLFHPGLPTDTRHNSKIVREKLAVWASKQLS
jgi:olefin beta-lactone synthetase